MLNAPSQPELETSRGAFHVSRVSSSHAGSRCFYSWMWCYIFGI